MILADTSIWINHFRLRNPLLDDQIERQNLLTHPLVVGELAMGSLRGRIQTLAFLDDLPPCDIATHDEVRGLIEREGLYSLGLGFIDAHLLSSALITADCQLWTADKRLVEAAQRLSRRARLPN